MSGREHVFPWDVSDAEWADRMDDPTVQHLEDAINDLAAALLQPDLPIDAKQAILAQAQALRGMCALLEK